ncbi:hypothetical protein JW933_00840 [candidate division FCPU426 bacterium]|nr:hypothetical protein [candidate division FCPU426 bacterium]
MARIAFLLLFFLSIAVTAWPDWEWVGAVPINRNVNRHADAPSIAVCNDVPYGTWQEMEYIDPDEYRAIYVRHFNGAQWVNDDNYLNNSYLDWAYHSTIVFSASNTPYVAWRELDSTWHIYVKYFNGSSWTPVDANVNTQAGSDLDTTIAMAMDGETHFLAITEGNEVYGKHWNGTAWALDGNRLNVAHALLPYTGPSIALDNGTPWISWRETSIIGVQSSIFVKYYNGVDWELAGGALNIDPCVDVYFTSIAFANHTPYVAWTEPVASSRNLFVKHLEGGVWIQDGTSLNLATNQHAASPCLTGHTSGVYITWHEMNAATSRTHVMVKHLNGTNWELVGSSPLNFNATASALNPKMAAGSDKLYVIWTEQDSGINRVFCKSFLLPSPTVSSTVTATDTPTASPTITPSATSTASASGTPTSTPTDTPTASPTITPSATSTASASGTPTDTPSATASYTQSHTPSNTPSSTATATPSAIMTPTYSPSATGSPTSTATPTATPFLSPTCSPTATLALSPTISPTSTLTATPTPSLITTATSTMTPIASFSPTSSLYFPFFTIVPSVFRPAGGAHVRVLIRPQTSGLVSLKIYDLTGRLKATLWDAPLASGNHEFSWDGANAGSGTYLVYGEIDSRRVRGKLVLVR